MVKQLINKQKKEIVVVLDNIRSTHNVGSIFRTSDGAGVRKIYLCGYTPTPEEKNLKKIAKVSLGAEKTVSWEKCRQTWRMIEVLKKNNFFILALENKTFGLSKVSLFEFGKKLSGKNKIVLLLGNEVCGLSKNILKRADLIVEIPLFGKKKSLNVSVAFGIAAFKVREILKS